MEVIKKVDKELSQAVQKIGEKLYGAAKSAQGTTPESGQESDSAGETEESKSDDPKDEGKEEE